MIAIFELIFTKLYRAWYRVRLHWIAHKYGYKVNSFEWLPNGDEGRIVRITPQDDFEHTGDDCACKPLKQSMGDEDGSYFLIQHKEIFNDVQA